MAALLFAIGCSKTSFTSKDECLEIEDKPAVEFAKILSKAVFDSKEMRSFIKEQSLQQFDRDFDVFYPYVKDQIVADNQTFRQFLLRYTSEESLSLIEESMPLLNILVPDWELFDGFSAYNWDVNDDMVCVGFASDGEHPIYLDGELAMTLEVGEFPEFPVLIVKNNDRMKVSTTSSKALSDLEYQFIDDEFDIRLHPETKVEHKQYDKVFKTEDYSDFIPKSEVDQCVIDAYEALKNKSGVPQRDNIYYGMTDEICNGKTNQNVCEYIKRIRMTNVTSEFFYDDSNDFHDCPSSYTTKKSVTDAFLMNKFYYEGSLELYFKIFLANNDGTVTELNKLVSASFKDLFQLAVLSVDFRHKTLLAKRKWVYSLKPKAESFVPKWHDVNLRLPNWDIQSQSTVVNINVFEYDSTEEETITISITSSKTKNFDIEGNVKGQIANEKYSGDVKVGYGVSKKEEQTTTITTKVTRGSDDLGQAFLSYTDKIITSEETRDGVPGYIVKPIGTGEVLMQILPVIR